MVFDKWRYFFELRKNEAETNESTAIQREQDETEIIISWTQLGFSIFMLTTWVVSILSRKSSPEYEIVPFILGPYTLFSIAKISWARKGLVNDAVLTMSSIVDISLVTSLIWLFHIQYEQTPGFYLKVPTFIYYFFFISLRSLRYDTKYLILTGTYSMMSWYGLLLYALYDSNTQVSRSFVEYTKSHHVLIGAEIEKTIGFFVVTAALMIATLRKRNLLHKSIEDKTALNSLTRFFSKQVAQVIHNNKETLKPGHGTTRFASILMIDLRNFTKTTHDWAPQDILKLISEYQNIVVPIILENNGCIDKYMGDGIFAHFGAASTSTTFARDALTAMEQINERVEEWNLQRQREGRERIEVGQAMAVGHVVFGTTGEKSRLEFTTIGSTVNLAAKLESHTKKLSVKSLTTLQAYNLAKDQGFTGNDEVTIINDCHVDGVQESLDIVVLCKRKDKKKLKEVS